MADQHELEILITAMANVSDIDKAEQAIEKLHDKTVTITIATRGGGEAGDAARALDGVSRAAEGSAGRLGEHAAASERAGGSMRDMADESSRAESAARALGAETERAAQSARELEVAGVSARRLTSEVTAAADASQVLAGGTEQVAQVMANAGAATERVSASVGGATFSTRSYNEVTRQAARNMESANRGLADAYSAFNRAAAASDNFAGGARRAAGGAGGGIPPINNLGSALGGLGDDAEGAAASGGRAARSFGMLSRALYPAAVAGVVAEVGMLALTAGTAGIGVLGMAENMRHSEPVMASLRQTARDFNRQFSEMAGAEAAAALPMMGALRSATHDLGHELAAVGVQATPQILSSVTALTTTATAALRNLEPAIAPSITGLTALGGAIMTGIGNSAPAISRFADSLTRNAPGIEKLVEGTISAASTVGSAFSDVAGFAGPIIGAPNAAGGVRAFVQQVAPGVAQVIDQADQMIGSHPTDTPGAGGVTFSSDNKFGQAMHFMGSLFSATGTTAGLAARDLLPSIADVPRDLGFKGGFSQTPFGQDIPAIGKAFGEVGSRANDLNPAPPPPPPGAPAPGSPTSAQLDGRPVPTIPGAGTAGPRPLPAGAAADIAAATAAYRGLGQTAQTSMSQVNQSSATGGQGVQQHMQQATQAVNQAAPALQNAATKIPQSIAQGASSQPGAVSGAVRAATSSAAPAASTAGADAGASMAGGMGKSLTKSENDTLTIAKKWTTRVTSGAAPAAESGGADAGAAMGSGMGKSFTKTVTDVVTEVHKLVKRVENALGIASPSKVFMGIGQNVGQGLVLGLESTSGAIGTASQQMAANVVQGATSALGGAPAAQQMTSGVGTQLAGLGQQYGQQFGAGAARSGQPVGAGAPFSPGQAPPQPSGGAGRPPATQPPGGMPPRDTTGRPLTPDEAIRQGVFPAGSQADVRSHLLGRITNEPEDYLRRAEAHNERANRMRADIQTRHEDAQYAALHGWEAAHQRQMQREQDPARFAREHPTPQQQADQRRQQVEQDKQRQAAEEQARRSALGPFAQPNTAEIAADQQASARNAAIQGEAQRSQQLHEQMQRQAQEQGQHIGQALPQGIAQGIAQGQDQATAAAVEMARRHQEEVKKKEGVSSPSTVFAQIGAEVSAGMAAGLSSASDSIQGVASDRGLQVGYVYGRSVVTGADEVIQKDLFQGISFPQIDSPQAKEWLGAMGFLGPAGSGASIGKTRPVTLGGSGATTTPQLNATINLTVDGTAMRVIAQDVVDVSWADLANEIPLQRG